MPGEGRGQNWRRKYPWEKWMGKRRFTIRRGVHYECGQVAMVQQIRNAASRLGVRVSVTDGDDRFTVVVLSPRKEAACRR